jgi:hypothetical protein
VVTRRIERCIRLVWIRDLLVREASNRWLRSHRIMFPATIHSWTCLRP